MNYAVRLYGENNEHEAPSDCVFSITSIGNETTYKDGYLIMSQAELDAYLLDKKPSFDAWYSGYMNQEATKKYIETISKNAMIFANDIYDKFTTENIGLGITQLGLTAHVLNVLKDVEYALRNRSLYEVINKIKAINPSDLDPVILSESRLLEFRNSVEGYLGLPKATVWNQ